MANPSAWLAKNKTAVAIAGIAGAGGLALWMKSKANSSAASTAAPSTSTNPSAFDSSQLDQYDQLASAISNLNDQVGLLEQNNSPTSNLKPPSSATINPTKGPIEKGKPPTTGKTKPFATGLTQSVLDAFVGAFSAGLKTPTQAQAAAERKAAGSTPAGAMAAQAWNVGQLTALNGLRTPTLAQVHTQATSLFPNFNSLDVTTQNRELEYANVTLLEKLNPKKG